MPRTIRFHLDENADPAIADGLRRRGVDVTTTQETGLRGADDVHQFGYVIANGRMLFTQDEDFLQVHASGQPHPGIAYCHTQSRSVGEIVRGLILIWEIYDPDEISNQIEWI